MPTPHRSPAALPRDIEFRFPRHARSVGRARVLLREQATSWKLPDELTDTAVLLLSELMTNAYRHAKVSPGLEIRARCVLSDEGRLRVSVADADGTLPAPREASPDDESGRGLTLVQALADDWGTEPRPGGIGKTVWFELSPSGRPAVLESGTEEGSAYADGQPSHDLTRKAVTEQGGQSHPHRHEDCEDEQIGQFYLQRLHSLLLSDG
ncbi:ATP-binding protein [Streptomyces sp. SID2888]|uniref:ATP-binding protein n=1 Tax=Streptomyces sp. SID2888 TaxID=2690256 RepID=UPI00136F6373|nr:ATP-binding protein [Streptomyces sp. SID2888]MYV44730.1 ATP-binding protein [Streptomyces sp. SID2888]